MSTRARASSSLKGVAGVRMWRFVWLPCALLPVVLGACGTTVPQQTTVAGGVAQGDEFSVVPTTTGTGGSTTETVDGSPGVVGSDTSGGSSDTSGGSNAESTSATADSGGSVQPGGQIPGRHPGVTDNSITIGFVYVTGVEAFGESMGFGNTTTGNPREQAEAVAGAINDAGGIGGRQVRLLTYAIRSGQPLDAQYQAACSFFTQDNNTFAVAGNLGNITAGSVLYDCLGASDVAYVESVGPGSDEDFGRFQNVAYAPATLSADRAATLMIDALADADWFGASPVIGVHSLDTPTWRRLVDRVVKPRLTALGYTVEEEFYFPLGATGSENAGTYSGAALRFKSAGVTHVIDVAATPILFAPAAESIDWRPRWSVYSDILPTNWANVVPRNQLIGSLGVGWAPSRDLQPADRGEPVNAAEQRCADVMRAAGQDPTPPLAWQFMLSACSPIFFLQETLAAAPEISTAGLAAGMAAIGDAYQDPHTWQTHFIPGRRDGLGAYRMLGFVEACSCYQYVSELRPVP